MNKKSKKAFAIETIVEALKAQGYEKNHITGDLVYQGVFDDLGTELVEGLESKGFLKGNLNDFYRYLKQAKEAIFDAPTERAMVIDDPVITSARQLQEKIAEEANGRIQMVRDEHELIIQEKDDQISAFKRSADELQALLERLREENLNLKATSENLQSETESQRQYISKVDAEKHALQTQLDSRGREIETERKTLELYRKDLKTQFEEKSAVIEAEKASAIAKADGQANHFGTQLHDLRSQYSELEAKHQQLKAERDQFKTQLDYETGAKRSLQDELSIVKQAKLDHYQQALAEILEGHQQSIAQRLDTVQSESKDMPKQITESIHSFIYRPLNEILEKLHKLESHKVEVVDE